MKFTIYHLKTCDTCRKAIKTLEAAGHELSIIDVRADGVPKDKLTEIVKAAGWQAVLNTRSTTWRGLSDADKADMNQARAIALMAEHPTLIKRPVIIGGSDISIGWKADVQAKFT